ncbi:MAG: MFS transporter [Paenibacillaceae bacterium]|nr:MFS transporter [Paenibacillaceae bacterium]
MNRLLWMGCFSYLLIGFAHVIVGSLMTDLLHHYDLTYKYGGTLVFAQFGGFLIGVLGTPLATKRLGIKNTLLLATVVLCAAEAVYGSLPAWPLMMAVAPAAGFGFGIIETVVGSVIIDVIQTRKAVAMSRLEVCFGLGALLMPLAAGGFIAAGIWQWAFVTLSALSLAVAVAWWRMPFHAVNQALREAKQQAAAAHPGPAAGNKQQSRASGRSRLIVLLVLFFAVYVGLEMGLVNFLPSMLEESYGLTGTSALLGVTLFWLTMSIGRLFAGLLAERYTYARYLLVSCGGSFALALIFASSGQAVLALVAVLLLGLAMSGIFSIALIFANAALPGSTERTTSTLIASGGVGGAVLPLLTGWSMDTFDTSATKWLLAALFAVMLLLFTVVSRLRGQAGSKS